MYSWHCVIPTSKAAGGNIKHPLPQSVAEVEESVELYLYFPSESQ